MLAALSASGRVVVADSHLACYQKLSDTEQNGDLISGFFDAESQHFVSDSDRQSFYDKELYLMRHGKCLEKADPDPDISEEGAAQVREAASLLSTQNLHSFIGISSPMLRCLRTASILHRTLGLHFIILPELMETPNSLKEGEIFTLQSRSKLFPEFDWPASKEWHVRAETCGAFFERVKVTLRQLPARSIVVAHYGYICLTAKMALCKDLLERGFPPASITYLCRDDASTLGWENAEVLKDRSTVADRKT